MTHNCHLYCNIILGLGVVNTENRFRLNKTETQRLHFPVQTLVVMCNAIYLPYSLIQCRGLSYNKALVGKGYKLKYSMAFDTVR